MQGQWFFRSQVGGQQFLVKSIKSGISARAAAPARIYLPYKFMGGALMSPDVHVLTCIHQIKIKVTLEFYLHTPT